MAAPRALRAVTLFARRPRERELLPRRKMRRQQPGSRENAAVSLNNRRRSVSRQMFTLRAPLGNVAELLGWALSVAPPAGLLAKGSATAG